MKKYISWFSCGAASAVATKIALKEYGAENVKIYNQHIDSEHSDNKRFLKECEEWYGQKIHITQSEKYKTHWEVYEKTRYLVGPNGARCTSELKRKVAESVINWGEGQEIEIIGFTIEEKDRARDISTRNPERNFMFPLITRNLNKEDCKGMLWKANIKLPEMYEMGYNNNNCIGCVKGGAGYWNKIRVDFPEVFDRMAKQEREVNASIIRRNGESVFLDEMPKDMGNHKEEKSISCGIFCQIESDKL